MTTKIVRLASGEEIVCGCELKDGFYELKKPAILIPTGNQQLGLMPWLSYADLKDNTIKISEKFIVFVTEPKKDLMNEYNNAFGSGLFVPSGGPVGQGPVGQGPVGGPALKLTK
tara:strand:- start:303 stop:644 length:342 start_codon:yes stop_codon:yes gene_type:complete